MSKMSRSWKAWALSFPVQCSRQHLATSPHSPRSSPLSRLSLLTKPSSKLRSNRAYPEPSRRHTDDVKCTRQMLSHIRMKATVQYRFLSSPGKQADYHCDFCIHTQCTPHRERKRQTDRDRGGSTYIHSWYIVMLNPYSGSPYSVL